MASKYGTIACLTGRSGVTVANRGLNNWTQAVAGDKEDGRTIAKLFAARRCWLWCRHILALLLAVVCMHRFTVSDRGATGHW